MAAEIKIRPVNPSKDLEAITKIYNYYVTDTFVTFETVPLNYEEMEERIRKISSKFPYLVATINQKGVKNEEGGKEASEEIVIGYSYANTFRTRSAYNWTVETSIVLDKDYTGKGVGLLLYQELIKKLKVQGFVVAVAVITMPSNEPSVKFHEKLGFKVFGKSPKCGFKFDQWHDVWFLELRLNEPTIPPSKLW